MQYNSHILENKLRTIYIDTDSFPSFTALLLVNVGSRDESASLSGMSHFVEHMTFKGSKKYPTAFDISSEIEGIGAVVNAYTSKDHTGYWVKAPIHQAEKVIDVMADMILHSKLLNEEMDREKQVIIEEINMYEDMPARKVSDIFDEVLFKGSSMARDIAGTPKTVSSFTQAQVKSFMSTHYHPESSLLVISGGINNHVDELKSKINSAFGRWKQGKKYERSEISVVQSEPNLHIHTKETEQSHVCLGFRAFSYNDKRRYALTVLSAILGGGMSSRMFIQVRERLGLCYYISTGRELYEDTGYIVTQAGVKNDIQTMQKALRAMYKEHSSLANGEVTTTELTRAKELLKGRLILSLEDSHSMASFIAGQIQMRGDYLTPEEILNHIDAVSESDITSLAKELFTPNNMTITAIGPLATKDINLADVLS
ncbi:MAG: pitrilysin family protein [bacterium]|nr:pitrilysin family protein [bacterium]